MFKTLITSKYYISSFVSISVDEYNKEIEKYFGDSPELIEGLRQYEKSYYPRLGGKEFCISSGNVLFRYRENKNTKTIYVIGLIAKSHRMRPSDLKDVLLVADEFAEKIKDHYTLIASVNINSRKLIDRIKRKLEAEGIEFEEQSYGQHQFLKGRPDFAFDTIELKRI